MLIRRNIGNYLAKNDINEMFLKSTIADGFEFLFFG